MATLLGLAGCKHVQTTGASVAGPWIIDEGGVGALRLGAAIPAALLDDAEQRFVARFIADGVLLEGFELEEPPLTVVLPTRMFARYDGEHGAAQPLVDQLRDQAVRRARAGAKISSVIISSDQLRTAAGVGVGSSHAELEAAYPAVKLRPLPPTMGDDMCSARVDGLPGVGFMFTTCDAAREGAPVIRVDVRGSD